MSFTVDCLNFALLLICTRVFHLALGISAQYYKVHITIFSNPQIVVLIAKTPVEKLSITEIVCFTGGGGGGLETRNNLREREEL